MKKWPKNNLNLRLRNLVSFFILSLFLLLFVSHPAGAANNYQKADDGTLAASEWNALVNDFLSTGGGSVMGNVGIGTTTLNYKLAVDGTIYATNIAGALTGTIGASNVSAGDFGSNTAGGNFSFPGTLGIGTTVPNTTLEIKSSAFQGTLPTDSGTTLGSAFSLSNATGRGVIANVLYGGEPSFEILPNIAKGLGGLRMGNFNILGTGDEFFQLSPTNGTTGYAYFEGYTGAGLVLGTGTAVPILFRPNRTTAMTILSGGNVGIGMTGPTHQLEVLGTNNFPFQVKGSLGGGFVIGAYNATWGGFWSAGVTPSLTNYGFILHPTAGLAFNIPASGAGMQFDANDVVKMYLTSAGGLNLGYATTDPGAGNMIISGNVGIGTTSHTYKLDVQGGQANASGGLCIAGDCKTAWNQVSGLSYWALSGSNLYASSTTYNVGIGTATPNSKLEVNGNFRTKQESFIGPDVASGASISNPYTDGAGGLFVTRTLPINVSGPVFTVSSNNEGVGSGAGFELVNKFAKAVILMENTAAYSSALKFQTSHNVANAPVYSDVMYLNSSGNVGIGTTVPSTAKLVLGDLGTNAIDAGSARITGVATGVASTDAVNYNQVQSMISTATSSISSYWSLSGSNLFPTTSYNVGIGTTDPGTYKLNVTGGDIYGSANALLAGTTGLTLSGAGADLNFTGTGPNQIITASGVNLALMPGGTGNVGIGTTNPLAKLEVSSAGGAASGMGLRLTAAGSYIPMDFNTPSGLGGQFVLTGSSWLSGAFGGDELALASELAAGKLHLAAIGASGVIKFTTGGNTMANERMRIDSGGNVGIGATTPTSAKLVLGNLGTNAIDAGSARITGVAVGVVATDAVNYNQVQSMISTATSSIGNYWSLNGANIYNSTGTNVGIGTSAPNTKLELGSGQFTIPVGSAAAPSIVFPGNLTSGFYSVAGGTISYSAAGTPVVLFSANTGVGGFPKAMRLNSTTILGWSSANPDTAADDTALSRGSAGTVYVGTTAGAYNGTLIAGKIGIGTTGPVAALDVTSATAMSPTGPALIQAFSNTTNGYGVMVNGASADGNALWFGSRKSRGTIASPTIVQNGDTVGSWLLQPYDGTAYNSAAALVGTIDGTFTSGQRPPMRLDFYTNTAAGAQTVNMTIKGSGNVGIGAATPTTAKLVLGNLGTNAIDAGSARITGVAVGVAATDAVNYNQVQSMISTATSSISSYWSLSGSNLFPTISYNVGIGTTDPGAYKLKVAGNVAITGSLETQTGADFAEEFLTTSDLPYGTVVVMGDQGYKSVKPCNKSYDSQVVGVVSNNPSIIAGRVEGKHKAIIAMMGVVKVKATTINGVISRGDLLTTSGIPGYAMKSLQTKFGTVIGKALEDLDSPSGEINVLVNLQ